MHLDVHCISKCMVKIHVYMVVNVIPEKVFVIVIYFLLLTGFVIDIVNLSQVHRTHFDCVG